MYPPELLEIARNLGIQFGGPHAREICDKINKQHKHRDKKKLSRRRMIKASRIANRR